MENYQKKSILGSMGYWLGVAVIGIAFGVSLQFAHAWTNPTQAPPGGNVAGPVTTSAFAQYKEGALGIGGLLKAYLGIDVGAYDASGTLIGQNRITNVATPIDGKDAVNKDYVDAAVGSATFDMLHGWWAWHNIAAYPDDGSVSGGSDKAQADMFCKCSGYGSAKSFTETDYPKSDPPRNGWFFTVAVGCDYGQPTTYPIPTKIFKSIICQ